MKKRIKIIDLIIILVLAGIVISMFSFSLSRETGNQEIILMEIYKCAGPDTSTNSMEHYYIFENTSTVKIRNSNPDGSNSIIPKEFTQDVINNFQLALDEYIAKNVAINTGFYINERYTIEYNGKTVIVPNPSVANLLGYDSNEYIFYNTVENFINSINNH